MFEIVLWNSGPGGTMHTTGKSFSIKASGPCFISPAGYPSAWIYDISLNFNAPSSANGNAVPRPRYITPLAFIIAFAVSFSE